MREHRVAKYVCPACSAANAESGGGAPASIVQAPGPALPLPGTWASASLLAHVMRQKYELALPIYRIAGDLSSQQRLPVSRQTLSGWVIDAYGRWLARLYPLIRGEVLSHDIVHCDETPVQVLKEPRRKPQSKSYMWLFASAACDRGAYVFEHHPTRGKTVVESFLGGWSGTIVTDGYAAYENLGPAIRRVSCIVHIRRGFYKIVKDVDYLEWVLSEMPKAEAAGELDAARFLPWSPDVPERCRSAREESEAVFRDEPIVDVDVDEYEEIVG